MEDFIFGSLANDALRVAHERLLRGGVTHRSNRNPIDPSPGEPVRIDLTVGPAHPCDRAWVYWSMDGRDPEGKNGVAWHGYAVKMEEVGVIWDTLEWGYRRHFQAIIPGHPSDTVVRYTIGAETLAGVELRADQGAFYGYYVAEDTVPAWAMDAVVYQIFVDRFHPGKAKSWFSPDHPSGFYGGTLRGIIEKLDYIVELGVNTLWLSPIFPSPSHHGYDATDYLDIEPRLGSKDDLKDLLQAAHARDVRVLLDFVPNHCSDQHPFFKAAISDPNDKYVEWFNFQSWPEKYECFFGVESLPNFNFRKPEARKYVLDAARYWLEFGVDGFRLDYAIGPPRDFWADFRRVTRLANPECWTFGEVVEPSDSQLSFKGLIDGCLDFVLLESLRQTFAFQRWDANKFSDFLLRHEDYFPKDFSRPSFLDNHDMNRFLWVTQGNKRILKLAALCQFTLTGPPIIYYGTEVGLSQHRDVRQNGKGILEESRLPMLWEDDQDWGLFEFYRQLIEVRRSEAVLRYGSFETISVDPEVLAYQRSHDGRELLTLINLGDQVKSIELDGTWKQILIATDQGASLKPATTRTSILIPGLCGLLLRA